MATHGVDATATAAGPDDPERIEGAGPGIASRSAPSEDDRGSCDRSRLVAHCDGRRKLTAVRRGAACGPSGRTHRTSFTRGRGIAAAAGRSGDWPIEAGGRCSDGGAVRIDRCRRRTAVWYRVDEDAERHVWRQGGGRSYAVRLGHGRSASSNYAPLVGSRRRRTAARRCRSGESSHGFGIAPLLVDGSGPVIRSIVGIGRFAASVGDPSDARSRRHVLQSVPVAVGSRLAAEGRDQSISARPPPDRGPRRPRAAAGGRGHPSPDATTPAPAPASPRCGGPA